MQTTCILNSHIFYCINHSNLIQLRYTKIEHGITSIQHGFVLQDSMTYIQRTSLFQSRYSPCPGLHKNYVASQF